MIADIHTANTRVYLPPVQLCDYLHMLLHIDLLLQYVGEQAIIYIANNKFGQREKLTRKRVTNSSLYGLKRYFIQRESTVHLLIYTRCAVYRLEKEHAAPTIRWNVSERCVCELRPSARTDRSKM